MTAQPLNQPLEDKMEKISYYIFCKFITKHFPGIYSLFPFPMYCSIAYLSSAIGAKDKLRNSFFSIFHCFIQKNLGHICLPYA